MQLVFTAQRREMTVCFPKHVNVSLILYVFASLKLGGA